MEQQRTANARPQECQEHEITPLDNIQCDDQFLLDYATMPHPRVVPNPLQDMRQDIASDASDAADDFDADDAADELNPADELDASDEMFSDDDWMFYVVMVLTLLYYKIMLLYNILFIFYCK